MGHSDKMTKLNTSTFFMLTVVAAKCSFILARKQK